MDFFYHFLPGRDHIEQMDGEAIHPSDFLTAYLIKDLGEGVCVLGGGATIGGVHLGHITKTKC